MFWRTRITGTLEHFRLKRDMNQYIGDQVIEYPDQLFMFCSRIP